MGYAGGTTADPTYHRIGDHSETFEIDFDADVTSFDELLDVFWGEHSPTARAWSTQYAHIAFWHDESQREAIDASGRRVAERLGLGSATDLSTQIRRLDRFYVAEDYHQKYYLRGASHIMREFKAMFGEDEAAFRDSTAAARVNGFVDGCEPGSADISAEIGSYGMSPEAQAELLRRAGARSGGACGI